MVSMKTHVGFTGTQQGMSIPQKKSLSLLIPHSSTFHHGDCIGSDAEAHEIARTLNCFIIQHPPLKPYKRAFTRCDEVRPAKDYLARNRDIVDCSELLLATPRGNLEELRSGTWATIRYARKQRKRLCIIYPDGTIFNSNHPQLTTNQEGE